MKIKVKSKTISSELGLQQNIPGNCGSNKNHRISTEVNKQISIADWGKQKNIPFVMRFRTKRMGVTKNIFQWLGLKRNYGLEREVEKQNMLLKLELKQNPFCWSWGENVPCCWNWSGKRKKCVSLKPCKCTDNCFWGYPFMGFVFNSSRKIMLSIQPQSRLGLNKINKPYAKTEVTKKKQNPKNTYASLQCQPQ